jgi:hypothetical protein
MHETRVPFWGMWVVTSGRMVNGGAAGSTPPRSAESVIFRHRSQVSAESKPWAEQTKASSQNCQPFNESSDKGQRTKTQPTDFFVLQSLPPHLSYPVPFKMSGAAQASSTTTKATTDDKKQEATMKDQQKPNMALEEDDEFEDFPVEGKDSPRVFTFAGCFRKALC